MIEKIAAKNQMKNMIIRLLWATLTILGLTAALAAQTSSPPPPPPDEPDFIVPARPTVSNPAEFQKPGVLQLEFGYDGNFHAPDVKAQEDLPLALRFAISRRWLIELDTDSPDSQKDTSNHRETGAGDTQLGIQGVLQHETKSHPGIALAYYIKLPTASREKSLGTGRVDQSFIGLFSKKIAKTTIDFNAIYLLAGRTRENGYTSSGQGAFAVTQEITRKFGLQGELNGLSRSNDQSGGVFGLGVMTYQIGKRIVFDGGLRFGLTPKFPRVGVVAGMTVGVGNLYHH